MKAITMKRKTFKSNRYIAIKKYNHSIFGQVYQCQDTFDSILKIIKPILKRTLNQSQIKKQHMYEVPPVLKKLIELRNEYVVQIYQYFQQPYQQQIPIFTDLMSQENHIKSQQALHSQNKEYIGYIVIELLEGQSLKKKLKSYQKSQIIDFYQKMRSTIEQLREIGITQFKISNDNIILDNYQSPKITNFFCLKSLESSTITTNNSNNSVLTQSDRLDISSNSTPTKNQISNTYYQNLWNLGIILIEIFLGQQINQFAQNKLKQDPTVLEQLLKLLSDYQELSRIIGSLLKQNPQDRQLIKILNTQDISMRPPKPLSKKQYFGIFLLVILGCLISFGLYHTIKTKKKQQDFLETAERDYFLGRYIDALNDYSRAIQKDPTSYQAYYGRGMCKFKLGKLNEAILDFDKAIQINDKFAQAYYNRGLVKQKLRIIEGALQDISKAANLQEENRLYKLKRDDIRKELRIEQLDKN